MLYVTQGTGSARYWYQGTAKCSYCSCDIPMVAFHVRVWMLKGDFYDLFVCPNCINKIPEISKTEPIQEKRQIILCDSRPPNCNVVLPRRPEMVEGKISVFDAAQSNKGVNADSSTSKVIDKTMLAGRSDSTLLDDDAPVLLGADVNKQIEEKDKVLSEKDAVKLLESKKR